MSDPISTVVRVAATPEQAKVFVALLEAEGIPAHVDGDSLVDEFATSRRLMNLIGCKVKVPTHSLERAREILANVEIDAVELERQALAAPDAERLEPRPQSPVPPPSRWPMFLAAGGAVTFLVLWLVQLEANAASRDPRFSYEMSGTTISRLVRRSDGRLLQSFEDRNTNGFWDRVLNHDPRGAVVSSAIDDNENGVYETYVEHRPDGVTVTWSDRDEDNVFEEARTCDAGGRVLQTLVRQPGAGYVVKTP